MAGGNSSNLVRAARTTIDWLNSSNVCGAGASYSVSVDNGSGWVQVGWRYYSGYASPKGYCERNPLPGGTGTYSLTEYNVPHATQVYSYRLNTTDQYECAIAGTGLQSVSTANIGFVLGNWVPVQAEAHATHVQLGFVEPQWFSFASTEKILYGAGASAWTQMNVNGVGNGDTTVWKLWQPAPDGFKVSTLASH